MSRDADGRSLAGRHDPAHATRPHSSSHPRRAPPHPGEQRKTLLRKTFCGRRRRETGSDCQGSSRPQSRLCATLAITPTKRRSPKSRALLQGTCVSPTLFADRKTTSLPTETPRFLQALGDEVDVDSEVYCWLRGAWCMRATLGLMCAQAASLCTQVVGHTRSRRSRPRH